MPANRKTWLPSRAEKSSSEPRSPLSTAQILAGITAMSSPPIPIWALEASFAALLGRDNRKILPDRAASLIKLLLDFVLTIEQVEAKGIVLNQAEKDLMVKWFTRDVLTFRPPAHPPHVLALHSHLVDRFIQSQSWPVLTAGMKQRYETALSRRLPTLFAELTDRQSCRPDCARRLAQTTDDVSAFAALTSPAALRDAIVAFHHGIASDSMRGARVRQRPRRHRHD